METRTMMTTARHWVAALMALHTLPAQAGDHVVPQKGNAFAVKRLEIRVGDTVRFLNLDPVPHNAFSLSPGNPFDTKILTKGESRDISFDNPGIVDIECAIHPGMQMSIEVRR
ncbi:MAG TPA: plastocyanin/azurin family copper-binding protein [Albitalea sp.]|uniref:cupredoxin domain-containing protein n=1 Tax=Piscinibacter sp. TaxID=1903157 RepID=UPI002ED0DF3E